MHERPQGYVTFLFTDIEGSTRLWELYPTVMWAAFGLQEQIIRQVSARHAGFVYKMIGDAFQVAFASPIQALLTAVEAQRDLAAATWGETGQLHVRMALHSGATQERNDDYVGPLLNRLARMLAAGYGDQILLSEDTVQALHNYPPTGIELRNLGLHALRDLTQATRIFQAIAPGLPSKFPPLKTAAPPTTHPAAPEALPLPATPFIGREEEVADLLGLAGNPACRLITIVGLGGTGKTRLAIQVARQITAPRDGILFISAAAAHSHEVFVALLGDALGCSFPAGADAAAQVVAHLAGREMLLILDNLEQLLPETSLIGQIVAAAPGVHIIATSREPLAIQAEWIFHVHGMPVPACPNPADIAETGVGMLFIDSARRVRHDFAPSAPDWRAIGAICRLVDGLPLAIELAASLVRLMSCQEIAAEIERDLGILATRLRDAPQQQQSMAAILDYAWLRLDADEQRCLQSLSLFASGFQRHAAEHIAGATITILARLIDAALLRRDATNRYVLHELIRQYAAGRLGADETLQTEARRRYCAYYAALLRSAVQRPDKNSKEAWASLSEEIDNIRLAWRWSVQQRDISAIEHLMEGLFFIYQRRGWLHEAEEAFGDAIRELGAAQAVGMIDFSAYTRLAGLLLMRQGVFLTSRGIYAAARERLAASIDLLRRGTHTSPLAMALNRMGYLMISMDRDDEAKGFLEESLAHSRTIGDQTLISDSLIFLANLSGRAGEHAQAIRLHEESLAIIRTLDNNEHILSGGLNNFGYALFLAGDYERARPIFAEALALRRQIGALFSIAISLLNVGYLAIATEDLATAGATFREALQIALELGNTPMILDATCGLALYLGKRGQVERAVELLHGALTHPDVWKVTIEYTSDLRARFEQQLAPPLLAAARARGAGRDPEAVAAALLDAGAESE